MRPSWLRLLCVSALVLVGAPLARAAAPWGPLESVGSTPTDAPRPADVAVSPNRSTLVAFRGTGASPFGAVLTTIAGTAVASTGLDPLGTAVAVANDHSGAAVAAWIRTDGIYAAIRSADGVLSSPVRILEVPPERSVRAMDLETAGIAVNGGRRAVLVAIVDNHEAYSQGGRTGAVHAVRLSGSTWSPPVRLASGLRNPLQVDLAGTSSGGAAAVWSDRGTGTDGRVFAARMTTAGVWRDFGAIASRTAEDVAITVDETAAGTVAWVQRGPGPDRLLTRERRSTGGYGTAVQVATGNLDNVGLATDAAGRVTMAWIKRIGAEFRLQHSSRPARGAWSPVGVLTVTPRTIPGVAVSSNQRGDLAVAWSAIQGTVADHYVRYRRAGAGFGARESLAGSLAAQPAEAPGVAVGGSGQASAVVGTAQGACCIDLFATTRASAPAPTVTALSTSPTRIGAGDLRLRFRLSRAGRVVIAIRAGAEQHPLLVRTHPGRAGANTVLLLGADLPRRPGRYTISVGVTVGPREPGVRTTTYQRTS